MQLSSGEGILKKGCSKGQEETVYDGSYDRQPISQLLTPHFKTRYRSTGQVQEKHTHMLISA